MESKPRCHPDKFSDRKRNNPETTVKIVVFYYEAIYHCSATACQAEILIFLRKIMIFYAPRGCMDFGRGLGRQVRLGLFFRGPLFLATCDSASVRRTSSTYDNLWKSTEFGHCSVRNFAGTVLSFHGPAFTVTLPAMREIWRWHDIFKKRCCGAGLRSRKLTIRLLCELGFYSMFPVSLGFRIWPVGIATDKSGRGIRLTCGD
jgi:hypothetical protein